MTRLQFPKDVHFGDEAEIWLPRSGDVLNTMYLRVQWPPLASGVDDSAGTRMIDYVELLYEDQLIERHYGETMEIVNDLEVPQAKQAVLTQLLGKGLTSNLATYSIRMPFTINLPVHALETHALLRVKFRPTSEFTYSGFIYTDIIKVDLFVDYVYLTQPEKDYFKKGTFDYVAKTFQRMQFSVAANTTRMVAYTSFVNSVNELYWVIQNDGSPAYNYTNQGSEQLVSLQLTFNKDDIIPVELGTPLFLRSTQGLTYHTRIPDRKFYFYNFCLDPESEQPTGQVNLSDISNQIHTLQLSSCVFSRQVRIYARTNNIIRIARGKLRVISDTIKEAGTLSMTNYAYSPQYPGLYYFNTFTFTTLGATGYAGPASTLTYANAPWSTSQFSIVNGIQNWTVPATGMYQIKAAGAYGSTPGRVIQGNVVLAQGQVISILVGQKSTSVVDAVTLGGGGGTYIVSGTTPLLVAAGGDSGSGAVAALGFSVPGTGVGNDGAGFYTDGANINTSYPFLKPKAYINGGNGNQYFNGTAAESGGFGGGQTPKTSGIAGGGGYTGSSGSGATSYVNPTLVTSATDLGITSNSSGYVTVSLSTLSPVYTWSNNIWTTVQQYQAPGNISWNSVTYGNGLFVAVSTNISIYSADGVLWVPVTTPGSWNSVTFGNGYFVAVGPSCQMYSTDGKTWNILGSPVAGTWLSVTYGQGSFIATGTGSMSSTTNGASWIVSPTLSSTVFTVSLGMRIGGTGTVTLNSIFTDQNGKMFVVGNSSAVPLNFYATNGTTVVKTLPIAPCSFFAYYDVNGNFQFAFPVEPSTASTVSLVSIAGDTYLTSYVCGFFTGTILIWEVDRYAYVTPLTSSGGIDACVIAYANDSGQPLWVRRIGGALSDKVLNMSSYGKSYTGDAIFYLTGQYASSPLTFYNADTSVTGVSGTTPTGLGKTSTLITVTAKTGTFAVGMIVAVSAIGGTTGITKNPNAYGTISATGFSQTSFTVVFSATTDISVGSFSGAVFIMPSSGAAALTLPNYGGTDGFVAKYDISGNLLWGRIIGGTGDDQGLSVAASHTTSNCAVTGNFTSTTVNFYATNGTTVLFSLPNSITASAFVATYTPDGTARWAMRIGGSSGTVTGTGVTYDLFENTIVIGTFTSPALYLYNTDGTVKFYVVNPTSLSSFIISYNVLGVAQWVRIIGGGSGVSISCDLTNYLTVNGTFSSGVTFNTASGQTIKSLSGAGGFIAIYSNNGDILQVNRLGTLSGDVYTASAADYTTTTAGHMYSTATYTSNPCNVYNADGSVFKAYALSGVSGGLLIQNNRSGGTAGAYVSVAYGNGLFVAVNSLSTIIYSGNGSSWASIPVSTAARFDSVAYGNGIFVVVGPANNYYSSAGFYNWLSGSPGTFPGTQNYSITFSQGLFFVVGRYSGSWYSKDSLTWTAGYFAVGSTTNSVNSLTYGNNILVAVGSNPTYPVYYSSATDNFWIVPKFSFGAPDYLFPYMYGLVWVPQLYSFVATISQKGFMTSPDGKNWTFVSNPSTTRFNSIAWSPELGIVVSLGGNSVGYYSTNLTTWTSLTCPLSNDYYGWCSVAWAPSLGVFAAVGCVINVGDYPVTYSTNGKTWLTPVTTPPSSTWKAVTWSPDLKRFVAVAGSSFTTFTVTYGTYASMYSNDGITWFGNNSLTVCWNAVTWSPKLGLFVAVGDNNIMYSSDGNSWTNVSIPSMIFNSVVWSPELAIFVAAGGSSQYIYSTSTVSKPIYTSKDGKVWSTTAYSTTYGTAVAWSPELGVFTGAYGSGYSPFAYTNSLKSF